MTGSRERYGDSPEDLELASAVDACRVEQVVGHGRGEVDVGQIDAEGEERERQDHRERRIDEVNHAEFEEDRQRERGVRDEHDHERRDEHDPPALEVGHRERVARRNRHDDRDHQRDTRVQHRVAEPGPDDAVLEPDQNVPVLRELVEGSEAERLLAVEAVELSGALRRCEQQPRQGEDEEDTEEREDGDHEHAAQPAGRSGRSGNDAQISRGQESPPKMLIVRRSTAPARPRARPFRHRL